VVDAAGLDGGKVGEEPLVEEVLEGWQIGNDVLAQGKGGVVAGEALEDIHDTLDGLELVVLVGVEFELKLSCHGRS